ncbi:MAG: molybdenum cofactor guanylyltransferase [Capsulimonadales bacterium]|nr:molybdenum cofactor guanylyltransferase [Capsulimonadales bacterium]
MTVAILAGGQSVRMGQDKALLPLDGETLLERTIRMAIEAGAETVLVIGRERPADDDPAGAIFLPDAPADAGQGPLAGLAAALEAAPTDRTLLLACDMPCLTAEAIRWLASLPSDDSGAHGTVTVGADGEPEPLFSVYSRAVRPLVRERLASGRRSLKGLIETGAFTSVALPEAFRTAIVNANTPEEWQAALRQRRCPVQ